MKGNSINNCDFLKFIIRIRAAILITCHGCQKPSYATDIGREPSTTYETQMHTRVSAYATRSMVNFETKTLAHTEKVAHQL